uniref:HHLA1 neighbor of OC90 n=1 Tax=Laticauda laticaudata TaxID=8630 RepID=A0A8C5RCA2_LATLA
MSCHIIITSSLDFNYKFTLSFSSKSHFFTSSNSNHNSFHYSQFHCNLEQTLYEGLQIKDYLYISFSELPAKLVDLAAMNLTGMVNGMLNTALRGTKEFFSFLSIVSYSSYAFHKVSIVLYNISSLRNIDPTKFSTRYCYCLNNRTNDLTDFTALLVDIVGNSTSYLTEIFKSTSIVSVSQSNDTDCIYICVISGRIGRNLTDLWEAIEKSPIVNYTFSGNISDFLGEYICSSHRTGPLVILEQLLLHPGALACHGLEQLLWDVQRASPVTTAALEYGTDFPTNVSKPPSVKIHISECTQVIKKGNFVTVPPLMVQKLNPCVMELCKFYQRCFCTRDRSYSRDHTMRYCIQNYPWFFKNAAFICEKVKRSTYSKSK